MSQSWGGTFHNAAPFSCPAAPAGLVGKHEKVFEKFPLSQSENHPKMSRLVRGGFSKKGRTFYIVPIKFGTICPKVGADHRATL